MAERYGVCRPCGGRGCLACAGSGVSGDAMVLYGSWMREEWEREPKAYPRGDRPLPGIYALMEAFYEGARLAHIDKAVDALRQSLDAQRKRQEGVTMQFKSDESSSLGGQFFVKLKDKESVVGVFRGEPYDFKQHWLSTRSQMCQGTNCPECQKGTKPSFRFRLNFVVSENGKYASKIFEQGRAVYNDLASLNNSGYALEKTIVKITRTGTDKATKYTILPLPAPQGTLTPDKEKLIAAVTLHDLANVEEALKQTQQAAEQFMDDIPF
jgi:hypothetical protein